MVLFHKGAREKYLVRLRDSCGDPKTVSTTATVVGGIVTNSTRRLLAGTASSVYSDTDGDWSAALIALDFNTTITDGVQQMTDAAFIMVAVDEGSGQVIYETPFSSVEIVPNPLG